LTLGDYGLLLRTKSLTNQVASPTKFAEYLAAGLQILVSPDVGDFSDFTIQHACGKVVDFNQFPELPPVQTADRMRSNDLAAKYFSKEHYLEDYRLLIDPKR